MFSLVLKVAVFKSMAAAVDWANGLEITSGSFQVAEVAPFMRNEFEQEVLCVMVSPARQRLSCRKRKQRFRSVLCF